MARTLEADLPRQITLAGTRRRRLDLGKVVLYAVLILIALFFLIPLIWMFSTSLKLETQVFRDRGFIPANPSLGNFQRILTSGGEAPVFRWIFNSFVVAIVGTALTVLLTSLSAYAFARIDFRGKSLLFGMIITNLLLPYIMLLVQ